MGKPLRVAGPFFVLEGHDVSTFRTREAAAGSLEAIDVRNNEFRFFAADGTELRLTTRIDPPRPLWAARLPLMLRSFVSGRAEERVVVTDEVLGNFAEDLRERLLWYLGAVPAKRRRLTDSALVNASLAELGEELARIASR